LTVKDSVKVARPADVPYPASLFTGSVPAQEEPSVEEVAVDAVETTDVVETPATEEGKEG
jgi:hypothetical protein